jgi:dynein regulatory complex protein 1
MGIDNVNEIKIGVMDREATRQTSELKNEAKWQERDNIEKQACKEVTEVIDSSWNKVEKLSGPFKLDQLLKTQKEACKQVLDIKDGLINEYLAELKIKDEEYVREIKRQREEIGFRSF